MVLLPFVLIYIGSVLGKFFFFSALQTEASARKKIIVQSVDWRIIVVPGASMIQMIQLQKYKRIFVLAELFGMVLFGVFSAGLLYLYSIAIATVWWVFVLHFSMYVIILSGLLYLSVYDLLFLHIPVRPTTQLLLLSILCNIVVGLLYFLTDLAEINSSLRIFTIGSLATLVIAASLYAATLLFVRVTREQYMGEGDADVLALFGLMLGFPTVFIFLLVFPILGGFLAISYVSLFRKPFRGTVIPMVPILTLSFASVVGLFPWFLDVFFRTGWF